MVVMILTQMQANEFGIPKAGPGRTELTASCGAMDRRECTMMKHILLAEIRRSNIDDEDELGIMAVILLQNRPAFSATQKDSRLGYVALLLRRAESNF